MADLAPNTLRLLGLTPVPRGTSTRYWRSSEEIRPGIRWWTFHRADGALEFGVKVFSDGKASLGTLRTILPSRGNAEDTFYESISVTLPFEEFCNRIEGLKLKIETALS